MRTVTTIVDTTHTDPHTLDRAFHLARQQHAKLHLHGMSYGYSRHSASMDKQRLLIDNTLHEIEQRARDAGIQTSTSRSYGDLWEIAFLAVLKHQNDPTVITSYPDRHLWRKWIPSKVINRFIFDFPCDVIMVKERKHWQSRRALVLLGPELSAETCAHQGEHDIMAALGQAARCGHQLEQLGLEVFYLCTYPDSQRFGDDHRLRNTRTDSQIMFCWGQPDHVVPPLIEKLNIDLLAVDISQATAIGRAEGHYIHQLGQLIECDIMASH